MMPADGITQYLGNAQQIGLLVVVFVAAAALCFDAHREIAVFFRTRASVRDIVVPRLTVSAVSAVVAFSAGAAISYVGTGLLLAWLDVRAMVVGALLVDLYMVFAVVVVLAVSTLVRSVPATALISAGALIVLGLLSLVSPLAPWLPSALLGALDVLIRGGEFDFWRAVAVTAALILILVPWSIRRLDHREV